MYHLMLINKYATTEVQNSPSMIYQYITEQPKCQQLSQGFYVDTGGQKSTFIHIPEHCSKA